MAVAGTISFINILIKRNYFEIRDDKLFINKDFFRTKTILLSNIERVKIESDPFTSSKIILKDNSQIKYLDSQINDDELKELMRQFNILVEQR